MTVKAAGPLQWQVPIVDKDGRPTPAFMRWFQTLVANDGLLDTGKQTSDADLDGLSALTGTGFVSRTADNTYAVRTLTAGANITITNPAGIGGNPVIASTASGSGDSYVPLVDGAEPPSLVTDGAGNLIFVPWSP